MILEITRALLAAIGCGIVWIIVCIAWFAWLHHKGELIADVPDNVKDIF